MALQTKTIGQRNKINNNKIGHFSTGYHLVLTIYALGHRSYCCLVWFEFVWLLCIAVVVFALVVLLLLLIWPSLLSGCRRCCCNCRISVYLSFDNLSPLPPASQPPLDRPFPSLSPFPAFVCPSCCRMAHIQIPTESESSAQWLLVLVAGFQIPGLGRKYWRLPAVFAIVPDLQNRSKWVPDPNHWIRLEWCHWGVRFMEKAVSRRHV